MTIKKYPFVWNGYTDEDLRDYFFIKRMVLDSDLNGVRYFNRIRNLINHSYLTERQKKRLLNLLEETSGLRW